MQFRLKMKNLEISAAHKLPDYDGKCKELHGHNYFAPALIVSGEKNEDTGMVVDFAKVKGILNEFDHDFINDYIVNPTLENIMEYWITKIEELGVKVIWFECYETGKCSCIYSIKDNQEYNASD